MPTKVIDLVPSIDNILAVYRRATATQIVDGMAWYERANSFARELDRTYSRSAGVIAALSPQTSWETNCMLARRAYADGTASGSLGQSIAKANLLLMGAQPLDVLGGDKVRSFYDNILRPNTSESVTIDRHAHDIAVNKRLLSAPRYLLTRKGGYEFFSNLYHEAGNELGISALKLQSITWVTWRSESND